MSRSAALKWMGSVPMESILLEAQPLAAIKASVNGKPGQIFHFTPLEGKFNSKMLEVQGPGSEQEKDVQGRNLRDCDL